MAEPTVEILAQFLLSTVSRAGVFVILRQPLANAASRRAWWGALWPQASSFAGATVQMLGTSMVAATFARCSRKASCAGPHLASGGFSRGAHPPGAVSCAENVSMQLRVCSLGHNSQLTKALARSSHSRPPSKPRIKLRTTQNRCRKEFFAASLAIHQRVCRSVGEVRSPAAHSPFGVRLILCPRQGISGRLPKC